MTTMLMTFEQEGQPCVNVYDIFLANVTANDSLAVIGDSWVSRVMPNLGGDLVFTGVKIGGDQPVEKAYNAAGGATNDCAPPNTAYVINKNPDTGRRGRLFLPGVTESSVDSGGNVRADIPPILDGKLDLWQADLVTSNIVLRIARSDGTFSNIESFTTQGKAGTQRRRLRR